MDKIAGGFGIAAACLAGGLIAVVEDQAARGALGLEPVSELEAVWDFLLGCTAGGGPPLIPLTAPAVVTP